MGHLWLEGSKAYEMPVTVESVMDDKVLMSIPVVMGRPPQPGEPEYGEMLKYESGAAERDAEAVPGPYEEPWQNVVAAFEPGSEPTLRQALADPAFAARIGGRVLDLGAGSCWATALLSKLEGVREVVALDLSLGFLQRVGARMIARLGGNSRKITFAVSTFEAIPFDDCHFDVVLAIAAVHHSLAPLRALIEARRVLRPGGLLVVVECPPPVLGIRSARERAIAESRRTGATEFALTRGELSYLIRHAGFESPIFVPASELSKSALKRWIRLALRRMHLEHLFLAVGYYIVAERA